MREQGKMLKVIEKLYKCKSNKEITIFCENKKRIETLILQFQQFILEKSKYKEYRSVYQVDFLKNGGFELEFYTKHNNFITINFVDLSHNKTGYIADDREQ